MRRYWEIYGLQVYKLLSRRKVGKGENMILTDKLYEGYIAVSNSNILSSNTFMKTLYPIIIGYRCRGTFVSNDSRLSFSNDMVYFVSSEYTYSVQVNHNSDFIVYFEQTTTVNEIILSVGKFTEGMNLSTYAWYLNSQLQGSTVGSPPQNFDSWLLQTNTIGINIYDNNKIISANGRPYQMTYREKLLWVERTFSAKFITSKLTTVNAYELVDSPVTGYNILYLATNGTISGPSTAAHENVVTLTVTPDTGYLLSSIAIYKTASQDPVGYEKVDDTHYRFMMPDVDVTVTGIFVRAYTISYGCVPSSAGMITGTESPSVPGAEIRFRISPDSNFIVSSVSVNAGQTELIWNGDTGIGRFIMPERNTYVTATLVTKDDPNEQGGTSEPETPEGTFDDNSSTIPIPSTPSTGVAYDVPAGQGVGKGLVTIYNPTLEELKDLGNYLYANSVTEAIWNGLRNIFANPMDAIISLHVLPFIPTRGTNKHAIALGPLNSQINSYIVSEQYQNVNMGTLRFQPYWDSYLDYSPYTKISLFLPYIGSVELNPDIVMGKLVGIRYRCDVLTGGCVAYLFTYEGEAGSTVKSVFGEYSGSMALSLPLSGSDFAQIISGFISAVSSVAIMKGAGTGALVTNANESVDVARQQLASAHAARGEAYAMPRQLHPKGVRGSVSNVAARNEAINNANNAYENAKEALQMARGQQRGVTALAGATHMATVPYTVGRVMGSKVNTTISGTITGGLGLLGTQKPYVIITRPRQSLATDYKHFVGYPSNITVRLNTLSGFTKVEQVELKNVPCTDTELAMLYDALKEGSYL